MLLLPSSSCAVACKQARAKVGGKQAPIHPQCAGFSKSCSRTATLLLWHPVCLQSSSVQRPTSRVNVQKPGLDDTGFVAEDNSGRSNIFPRKQQAYISSSRADAAAQQGLGGAQGEQLAATPSGW